MLYNQEDRQLRQTLGEVVARAVRQNPPAKDWVLHCMTCHRRYILQAIDSRVDPDRAFLGKALDDLDHGLSILSDG